MPSISTLLRLLAIAAITAVIAACSTATTATDPTVSGAWVRPPMGADRPAAGYLTITGGSSTTALVAVTADVAATVEIHETMAGHDGMAGMRPVERIEIPAGATVALEPGGYHLMLMGLTTRLEPGATVHLQLEFDGGLEVAVDAEVRAS
jgi:copper(I)-binding protein